MDDEQSLFNNIPQIPRSNGYDFGMRGSGKGSKRKQKALNRRKR